MASAVSPILSSSPSSPPALKKKFACAHPGCGKSFSRSEHLHRHALNHKDGNNTCLRCSAHFRRRDLLGRCHLGSSWSPGADSYRSPHGPPQGKGRRGRRRGSRRPSNPQTPLARRDGQDCQCSSSLVHQCPPAHAIVHQYRHAAPESLDEAQDAQRPRARPQVQGGPAFAAHVVHVLADPLRLASPHPERFRSSSRLHFFVPACTQARRRHSARPVACCLAEQPTSAIAAHVRSESGLQCTGTCLIARTLHLRRTPPLGLASGARGRRCIARAPRSPAEPARLHAPLALTLGHANPPALSDIYGQRRFARARPCP